MVSDSVIFMANLGLLILFAAGAWSILEIVVDLACELGEAMRRRWRCGRGDHYEWREFNDAADKRWKACTQCGARVPV